MQSTLARLRLQVSTGSHPPARPPEANENGTTAQMLTVISAPPTATQAQLGFLASYRQRRGVSQAYTSNCASFWSQILIALPFLIQVGLTWDG